MDKIRIIIVEDEPLVAFDLKKQLEKKGMVVTGIFESGEDILEFLQQHALPDIILMDVQLYGSLDGIDTAHEINKHHQVPILFLTANTDTTTFKRAKLTFPHAFLSKPFRIHDVLHAIELALDIKGDTPEEEQTENYLADRFFIRNNDYLEKVMYDHILFLEADGAYTKIHTNAKSYIVSQTLGKVENKIQTSFMLKVHRSYTINTEHVDKISEGYVHIDKYRIPVSRTYKEAVNKMFNIF